MSLALQQIPPSAIQTEGDAHLYPILDREHIDTGPTSLVWSVKDALAPLIGSWANGHLLSFSPSGSFAKGTANKSGTDIDLFISISETAAETLSEIYNKLFSRLEEAGLKPKRKRVSINIDLDMVDVDLVPAKRQSAWSNEHSLYLNTKGTWRKTDISKHIEIVARSPWIPVIRVLKLWRCQWQLDFPSFLIELMVISALAGRYVYLSQGVAIALQYIAANIETINVVDPANTNNSLSADLSVEEKKKIKEYANLALQCPWKTFLR